VNMERSKNVGPCAQQYNPSIWEAEAEGSWIWGQFTLRNEF
jgi:hypothetical protein